MVLVGGVVGVVGWGVRVLGRAGVVMCVGAGKDSLGPGALLPVAAAACDALVAVRTRMMDDDVPSALINLYSSGLAAIGSLALAFFTAGFTPLASGTDLLWIVGMGAFGGTAVLFLIMSYRLTEQSNLAPFSYFGIPLAFALGWIFYDEAPWSDLFPGAVFIVVGGLLIVWRERKISQMRQKSSPKR